LVLRSQFIPLRGSLPVPLGKTAWDHSLGISQSKIPVEDPMSLLYNMNDCYSKLKELMPSIPQNKKVTKMEILQHSHRLHLGPAAHPGLASHCRQLAPLEQNQASRTPLTTLNTDISILSLQGSEFPSELMSNDSKNTLWLNKWHLRTFFSFYFLFFFCTRRSLQDLLSLLFYFVLFCY
jgi:DNA-binding protein inhibitor ID2